MRAALQLSAFQLILERDVSPPTKWTRTLSQASDVEHWNLALQLMPHAYTLARQAPSSSVAALDWIALGPGLRSTGPRQLISDVLWYPLAQAEGWSRFSPTPLWPWCEGLQTPLRAQPAPEGRAVEEDLSHRSSRARRASDAHTSNRRHSIVFSPGRRASVGASQDQLDSDTPARLHASGNSLAPLQLLSSPLSFFRYMDLVPVRGPTANGPETGEPGRDDDASRRQAAAPSPRARRFGRISLRVRRPIEALVILFERAA